MTLRPQSLLSALVLSSALALAAGCNVFDESLLLDADAGPDGGGQESIVLADQCTGNVPVVVSSGERRATSTLGLTDTFRDDIAACTGSPEPGNDGFFKVVMERGDKWHFHLRLTDLGANPAVYVLRSCDERSCSASTSLDECGTGRDEHLSFVAPADGTYIVGVDSRNAGGADYEIEAVNPICGNSALEHSESCDDGNDDDGDGCTSDCRAEVTPSATDEVEPNDESTNANLAQPEGGVGQIEVHGSLGGRCDFDMWGLDVPAGGSVRATMLTANGSECPAGGTGFEMKMYERVPSSASAHLVGSGSARDGNDCPSIDDSDAFAADLDEGRYFVRVTTAQDVAAAVPYALVLEIVEAGGED